VEEEREAKEMLMPDWQDEAEDALATDLSHAALAKEKTDAEQHERLSREQIDDIADAVDAMSTCSAIERERQEMRELEEEREAHREEIDEAKESARDIAMLDSRVTRMVAELREQIDHADAEIGESIHCLDLDGDGYMSHDELVEAMKKLDPSKQPDEGAFKALLKKVDFDQDGRISIEEWNRAMKELQMIDRKSTKMKDTDDLSEDGDIPAYGKSQMGEK